MPGLIIELEELIGKISLKLISVKKGKNEKLTNMIKEHFTYLDVMEYDAYEKFMKRYVEELKIGKAKTIAEMLQKEGGQFYFLFR